MDRPVVARDVIKSEACYGMSANMIGVASHTQEVVGRWCTLVRTITERVLLQPHPS
jgi:hypothetical protein